MKTQTELAEIRRTELRRYRGTLEAASATYSPEKYAYALGLVDAAIAQPDSFFRKYFDVDTAGMLVKISAGPEAIQKLRSMK